MLLDPSYPQERLTWMIQDANVSLHRSYPDRRGLPRLDDQQGRVALCVEEYVANGQPMQLPDPSVR